MKRILSLILVLVLVLGSMPLAFADEHEMTAGEKLAELGLVQGDEEGNLMEDETLTRAQMMVMLARLYDVEEEAMAFDLPSEFTDVDADSYYAPFIAYAAVQGWTDGVGDGMFAPDAEVGAQMVATFMLRILGYDVDWDNAVAQAAVLGIMDDMPGEAYTRANAFDMMYDAVNTKMANEDMTLGQKLGKVDYEDPEADVDVEVESVTATNLIQAVVEFNTAVDEDSATDEENYDIEGDDKDDDDIAIDSIELVDDMTAVITFEVAVAQQAEYDVTIEGVLDVDEDTEVEETTFTVEALDNTLPTAVSAEVVGIDTVKVTFSEPIMDAVKGDFEVEDGDLYIRSVTMAANNTEANVELYSDLEEGVITIEAQNSIEDYAGFSIMNTTFDVEVVEDDEAPYVVSYKDADRRGVTLVFNEDIELASTDLDDFYHTNTSNPVSEVPTVDGNELELKFGEDEKLPEGVAYVYIAKESVNDLWDNENDTTIKTVVEITIDETAPKVVDITVEDEDEIEIEFDEEIDSDSLDEDNFTLLDEDGEEIENIIDSVDFKDSDNDVVVVMFDEDLSGDYTIVIEDLEDLSANAVTTISEDFFVEDLTDPDFGDFTVTLYKAGTEDQMIKIDFDEAMDTSDDKYSVTDLEKYTIKAAALDDNDANTTETDVVLSDYEAASISVLKGAKSIEIMLPYDEEDDQYEISTLTDGLVMMRVADDAGNYTKAQSAELDIESSGVVTFEAAATDVDTIELTFDDELAVFETDDFMLTSDGTTAGALDIAKVSTELDSDDNTVAIFTLDDDVAVNFTGTVLVVDNESENEYAEKIATGDVAIVDEIAPALAVDANDDDMDLVTLTKATTSASIVLEFEEALDSATLATTTFDVDGYDVDAISYNSTANGNGYYEVTLTINDDDLDDLEVGTDIDLAATIKDSEGNKLTDLNTEIYFEN